VAANGVAAVSGFAPMSKPFIFDVRQPRALKPCRWLFSFPNGCPSEKFPVMGSNRASRASNPPFDFAGQGFVARSIANFIQQESCPFHQSPSAKVSLLRQIDIEIIVKVFHKATQRWQRNVRRDSMAQHRPGVGPRTKLRRVGSLPGRELRMGSPAIAVFSELSQPCLPFGRSTVLSEIPVQLQSRCSPVRFPEPFATVRQVFQKKQNCKQTIQKGAV
jgi:hypothetical protein